MAMLSLNQARILIVDDQESNVLLLQEMLQDGGYTDYQAVLDSRQVLDTFTAYQPDIILLDLMMPHLDGYAVMDLLRPLIPEDAYLPILVLTADAAQETRRRALTAGARDFLTKPLDPCEVLLRIRNLLETRFLYQQQKQQAEDRIRELAELIDEAPDAIVVCDLEHRVRYWSKGAERLYGVPGAEAQGCRIHEVLGPKDPTQFQQAAAELSAKEAWQGELACATRNGKDLVIASRWTLAHTAEGKPRASLFIGADITEKKALESQLQQTQRMESIGILAGGIAHDLNNVLTPILMGSEVLAMKLPDPVSQSLLKTLQESAQRGAEMVNQILTFARGTEGQRQAIHLESVIKEMTKMARQTFPKNIEVRTVLPRDLWLVSGNSTQLYQVLMNLCVNARDAMPHGGTLTVTAENLRLDDQYASQEPNARPGPYVAIKVVDVGSGIPPEVLVRIFDPFFTTKEHGKGAGLGLSVTRGIVKNHDGFLRVESKVGQGTAFQVFLPALETAPAAAAVPAQALPRGQGELILIVDDEVAVARIAQVILEAHGYRVVTAGDGAEAIAQYAQKQHEVALVLTDLAMPIMDGPATIRALRHMNPAVRIIVASGLTTGVQAEAVHTSANAVLRKPYTTEKLLTTVRNVLRDSIPVAIPAAASG